MKNPINIKSIEEKLNKLRECIDILENLKITPQAEFLKSKEKSGAVMHYLVIGIEVVVDIGQHILSEVFQTRGTSYEEIISKLGEAKVVPKKFAEENEGMARFRNLLIHEYIKVDLNKVYQNLQKAPDIFRKFAKYYLKFLEKYE